MLGIGLGGFVDGMAKGYGLSQQIKDRELDRAERAEDRAFRAEDRAEDRKYRAEDRAYQAEDRAFVRSERNQQVADRDRLRGIQTDARETFEEGVDDGTYKADQFETFWTEYAMPKIQGEMILQGDVQGASALADWSETTAAKKGRNAFGEAVFLSQSGQHGAALDKAIEAGRVAGYIGDGYEISEKEELQDEDGTPLGYRLTLKDADGNETVQDVAMDDIPALVTQFANPQAAYQSTIETANRKRERAEKLEDHEAEAVIDQKYAKSGAPTRSKVIETIRKRDEANALGGAEDFVAFDDMDPEQQETAIQEEMALQTGSSTPQVPAAKVVVDNTNGRPVMSPEQMAQAPGLGQSTKPAAPPAPVPAGQGVGAAAGGPRPAPVINGRADTGLAAPPTETETLNSAAQEMVSGGDAQKIAQRLQAMQIPPEKWPSSVKQVLQQTGR